MPQIVPLRPSDVPDLHELLAEADLTLSGLEASTVRLWLLRDEDGAVAGSTGYELSGDGGHALVRSVAVHQDQRSRGWGRRLAAFALGQAALDGASRAWLFSRRSGPFRRRLGFLPADRDVLADVLADTHQVRLFARTGQLEREVAWSRPLADAAASAPTPSRYASYRSSPS